jgi:hypothetical protein
MLTLNYANLLYIMTTTRDVIIDKSLVSQQEDILGQDVTYTQYKYEKIPIQSGNASQWTAGSTLIFQSPQYEDSVWDLNDSYLEAKIRVHAVHTYNVGAGVVGPVSVPLSAFSSCAVEKYLMSGLLENVELQYGGASVQQFDANQKLFPILHSVYSTLTADSDKVIGSARPLNFYDQLQDVGFAPVEVRNEYTYPREWEYYEDAKHPFNVCQSADSALFPKLRTQYTGVPFPIQYRSPPVTGGNVPAGQFPTNAGKLLPDFTFDANHQYRSSLILTEDNSNPPTGTGPSNSTYTDGQNNVVLKLKIPFAEDGKKKPANAPIRLSLRRNKDISWSLAGDSASDALLSAGSDFVSPANIISSTYEILFDDLNLYAKRLTLAENTRMVLTQMPSLLYDMPAWQAQEFNLTGSSFNANVSFTQVPQLLLIGLIPKSVFNTSPAPPSGKYEKFISSFNTSPSQFMSFSELYVNTPKGKIPENSYQPVNSNGARNAVGSMRAYEEFTKVQKSMMACPIPYKTWKNNFQWFPFLISSNGENPHYQAEKLERSTLNVVANLVGKDNVSDHTLVVIGMVLNQMVLSALKSVVMYV